MDQVSLVKYYDWVTCGLYLWKKSARKPCSQVLSPLFPFLIAFAGDLSVFCRFFGSASGTAFAGFAGCFAGLADVLASTTDFTVFAGCFAGLADVLASTTGFTVFAGCFAGLADVLASTTGFAVFAGCFAGLADVLASDNRLRSFCWLFCWLG